MPSTTLALGASAGATESLELAETGFVFDKLSLFDPTGMRDVSKAGAFGAWGMHQLWQLTSGRNSYPNQHGLGYGIQKDVSEFEDMSLHGQIWSSDASLRSLIRIAQGALLPKARTRLYLPMKTFTLPSAEAQYQKEVLNSNAIIAGTDFRAERPDVPHRFTDDPERMAQLADLIINHPTSKLDPAIA